MPADRGSRTLGACMRAALIGCLLAATAAQAEDPASAGLEPASQAGADAAGRTDPTTLAKQANAPVSSILQLRLVDTFQPEFPHTDEDGNVFSISVTMPLPRYRLLPFSQLSLLTIPAAVTPPGEDTGFGDLRFVDVATFDLGRNVLAGIGPT